MGTDGKTPGKRVKEAVKESGILAGDSASMAEQRPGARGDRG